jgi:Matrixin
MILCPNLLQTSIIFVLTVLVLLPYLSSLYFSSDYIMAAHSSSSSSLSMKHKSTGEGTIQICCSWGNQIADGILTYRIIGGSNPQIVKVVHQAIEEWNSKVPNIQLQEITDSNTPADIDIKTNSKASKLTLPTSTIVGRGGDAMSPRKNIKLVQPGEARISFDASGLITHVDMNISTRALGNSIGSAKLELIAKHEIGHTLGIGHTDFVSDLMSPVLTGRTDTSISQCDINGIEEANQWKLKTESTDNNPHPPSIEFLRC